MTTLELEAARQSQNERYIVSMRLKLLEEGIGELAVLGPQGSDAKLAEKLAVGTTAYYDSYGAVMDACVHQGVAAIVPMFTKEGEPIGNNYKRWLTKGHASIGTVRNPITRDSTNVLIANPNSNREIQMGAAERTEDSMLIDSVRKENTDPAAIETGMRILEQALGAEAMGRPVTQATEELSYEPVNTYFVPSSSGS